MKSPEHTDTHELPYVSGTWHIPRVHLQLGSSHQEEQVHFCYSMSGCRKSINYSSTITRQSYTTSLILFTDLAIAFSFSSFTLSSVTEFPTVRLWWLPTLPSLLAKTQSPIPPKRPGSCLLYLVGYILKEDGIGWAKPITSQLLYSCHSSVFSKVCVLWWSIQPWSTDWWTHHNCQIFYAVQTHSPYPHAFFEDYIAICKDVVLNTGFMSGWFWLGASVMCPHTIARWACSLYKTSDNCRLQIESVSAW